MSLGGLTEPIRVGFESTCLLGERSGVGATASAVLERMAGRDEVAVTALGVSWRGRQTLPSVVPKGVGAESTMFPARVAHRIWQHANWPSFGGYDIVHGPNFVVPPGHGAAELVTIHDLGPWRFPHLVDVHVRAYPRLLDRAMRRGAHIHVPSAFVGNEVVEYLGIDRDRVHVILNGHEINLSGDPTRGRQMAGGPYVLAVGTIEPRKNFPVLVEAMRHVFDELPELRLVIAGAPGLASDDLESAIRRTGNQERVSVLGYVSDADRNSLLAGAECLAFPSLYEGFGLPPLEAMAYRTPVVAADAGSLPEVCGQAALLVSPADCEELARAIISAVADDDVASRLIAAGQNQVHQFSWDRSVDDLVRLYQRLGR